MKRGFSLWEILVVLILGGLLLSVAVHQLSDTRGRMIRDLESSIAQSSSEIEKLQTKLAFIEGASADSAKAAWIVELKGQIDECNAKLTEARQKLAAVNPKQ